jgi:GNAT superfamily N-acetyltransferase
VKLRSLSHDRLLVWRKKYHAFLGIPVIPDFHDALCQTGEAFMVEEAGHELGYVIITRESFLPDIAPVIPEFYFEVAQTRYSRQLLESLLRELEPLTILSRTDDTYGFPLLMDLRIRNSVAYSVYLLETEPQWAEVEDFNIEESSMDDGLDLLPVYASVSPEDGGIPDEMSLTKSLALWRHYRLRVEGDIVAVCYIVPQVGRYITAATIVLAGARGKGYGRFLTAYAVAREIKAGKTFVAASDPEKESARGLIESLGARMTAHYMYFRP